MYFIKWGQGRRMHFMEWSSTTAFFLAACLVHLSDLVAGGSGSSASRLVPSTKSSQSSTHSDQPHPHHRHHSNQYQQHIQPQPQLPSPSPHPAEAYSPSWYNAHMNDPRMGFFFSSSDSHPAPAPSISSSPAQKPKPAPLVPQPRSLSGFVPVVTPRPDGEKKRRKRKARKVKAKAATSNYTRSTALTVIPEDSSRTIFLTPLLAYLVPVFIAQMFGMGMNPAAALITLPIFLLPLGLTAAIFLI